MRQEVEIRNSVDENLNPAGGHALGNGIVIEWQDGPLGSGEDRLAPNGAFVEDIIAICIARLKFYQSSKFNCEENAYALDHLQQALDTLDRRTARRQARGVEGTHEV